MASFDNKQVTERRTSKGKQKIDIKKIEKKSSRQVAFCKRRNGLFKKCTELSSLYGSEYAAITFSVAGKPFSSGFPSPNAVIQRFLSDSCNDSGVDFRGLEGESSSVNWWDKPIENMGLAELEEYKRALEGLRNDVLSKVDLITGENEILGENDCLNVSDSRHETSELFDADDGIEMSELCQEKIGKRFAFGCKEAKLELDHK